MSNVFVGKHSELTDEILECFWIVYQELGYGFNEKAYEKAMVIVLEEKGHKVEPQKKIPVYFRGQLVSEYFADLIVDDLVMLELKATNHLLSEHEAQMLNYLKATEIEVGLLLNFGPKGEIRRKVFDNKLKGSLKWMKNSKPNPEEHKK